MSYYHRDAILTESGLDLGTWGFIIICTAYNEGYDTKFLQALDVVDTWVQEQAHSSPCGRPTTIEECTRIGNDVMAKYCNFIVHNEDLLKDISVDEVRVHCGKMRVYDAEDVDWEANPPPINGFGEFAILDQEEIDRIIRAPKGHSEAASRQKYVRVVDSWDPPASEITNNVMMTYVCPIFGYMMEEAYDHHACLSEWYTSRLDSDLIGKVGKRMTGEATAPWDPRFGSPPSTA